MREPGIGWIFQAVERVMSKHGYPTRGPEIKEGATMPHPTDQPTITKPEKALAFVLASIRLSSDAMRLAEGVLDSQEIENLGIAVGRLIQARDRLARRVN